MTEQCIEKTISVIDYQWLFPEILSPDSIWIMYDEENDEEESISNYCTLYSTNMFLSYLTCGMKGRKKTYWLYCDWLDAMCNSLQ